MGGSDIIHLSIINNLARINLTVSLRLLQAVKLIRKSMHSGFGSCTLNCVTLDR